MMGWIIVDYWKTQGLDNLTILLRAETCVKNRFIPKEWLPPKDDSSPQDSNFIPNPHLPILYSEAI